MSWEQERRRPPPQEDLRMPDTQFGDAREDAGDEALVVFVASGSGRLALLERLIALGPDHRAHIGATGDCGHEPRGFVFLTFPRAENNQKNNSITNTK